MGLCDKCPKRSTCKALCKEALAYVNQDQPKQDDDTGRKGRSVFLEMRGEARTVDWHNTQAVSAHDRDLDYAKSNIIEQVPTSREGKIELIKELLDQQTPMSHKDIAIHVGCSERLVNEVAEELRKPPVVGRFKKEQAEIKAQSSNPPKLRTILRKRPLKP